MCLNYNILYSLLYNLCSFIYLFLFGNEMLVEKSVTEDRHNTNVCRLPVDLVQLNFLFFLFCFRCCALYYIQYMYRSILWIFFPAGSSMEQYGKTDLSYLKTGLGFCAPDILMVQTRRRSDIREYFH